MVLAPSHHSCILQSHNGSVAHRAAVGFEQLHWEDKHCSHLAHDKVCVSVSTNAEYMCWLLINYTNPAAKLFLHSSFILSAYAVTLLIPG